MLEEPIKSKSSSAGSSTTPANQQNSNNSTHVDCSRAATGVWLVKVPNYLAKKWNEAPENSEVGVIRITQSKMPQSPKPKQEVVFLLNETLSKSAKLGPDGKVVGEEIVPLEHKFLMTPLGSQDMYILKQSEENSKEILSVIGKVIQRAECTPVHNDLNYLQLKRESNKKFNEPKKQIQLANDYIQKKHFLPKSTHVQNVEKKDKVKRLRKDREKVLDILFNAFNKHQYYGIKDLVKITQQPAAYLKDILHEICKYNAKGSHKNTWELKDEYKQGDATSESKKKAVYDSIERKTETIETMDDYMDDDEDLSDDDFEDDEEMQDA